MRLNIQTKLFLLLAGLTSAVLVGVLVAVSTMISAEILDEIIVDFDQTQSNFHLIQNLKYDRLVESALLIAENSTFKANVALADPATVDFSATEFAAFTKADLIVVTDRRGLVLSSFGDPGRTGADLIDMPGVAEALEGVDPTIETAWPLLWHTEEGVFQVATVPVFAANTLIGTLTLGARLTRVEAEALKGSSTFDISFFADDTLFASTLAPERTDAIALLVATNSARVEETVSNLTASRVFETKLGGESVFAFVSPLGRASHAYYLATVPRAEALGLLSYVRGNILIYALVSLVFTLVVAVTLGRFFARPIKTLVSAMRRLQEGDLTVSVTPSSGDEIGLLARAFNEMIVGLRERFLIQKYVGSHTLKMIRDERGVRSALGGTRRELAVLFSDIRGFTAFSERREPEEAIEMLNQFLGIQADVVHAYGGSVDKFVGDEMVALFEDPDGLERALSCAASIQMRIGEQRKRVDVRIEVGIGVNHGQMVMGNMGAEDRMDYTVIGSEVNLAARLCAAARPGEILVPAAKLTSLFAPPDVSEFRNSAFKGLSAPIDVAVIDPCHEEVPV